MLKTLDTLDEGQQENLTKKWMNRISEAVKREKAFRNKGNEIVNLYEGKTNENTPFAILYSNTETLQPALYNSRPIPLVTRRFKDADPVGKAAAEVSTRLLKFLIDNESADFDNYDELVQGANLEAILVNRGVSRFKYVAHEDDGRPYSECVYGEAVRWDKFFHGYARTWKKVPWIGFEWDMTADEIKKNFPGVAPLNFQGADLADEGDESLESREELQGVTTYKVYEIWDKITRKVIFFSSVSQKSPLRMVDDPLELSGFFPIARPLNFTKKVSNLVPTPLYTYYQSQAHELNDLTRRLKAIIKAIRYRGAYNSAVEGIEKMLKADDNELVPVTNMQSMPDNTTIDKLLYTVPVNELVQTAQSLYQQREACKQVIYEITGISDILRGASVASETATAQNIKNQWGTLRLRKMQREVARYCRETLQIILEIAVKKFEPQTIQAMTGLPYLFNSQKQAITAQFQQAQANAAAMGQQAQMMGQQPPPPPQLPPEVEAALQMPSWDDILKLLGDDLTRAYKTDIETNSTIEAESAEDKQDIADLLGALAQFFNGITPLVQEGALPMSVATEMMLVIMRRYAFGSQLEDMLAKIGQQAQQPKGPDPAEQAKAAAAQAQAQQTQAESEAAQAKVKMDMERDAQKHAFDMEKMNREAEIAQMEFGIKQGELSLQKQAVGLKLAQQESQHKQKMAAIAAQGEKSGD